MDVNHNGRRGRFIGRALGELSGGWVEQLGATNWQTLFPQPCRLGTAFPCRSLLTSEHNRRVESSWYHLLADDVSAAEMTQDQR